MKTITFLIFCSIVFQNCSHSTKEPQSGNDLIYHSEERKLAKEIPIKIKRVSCKADSLSQIKIILDLDNPASDSIKISSSDWELETPEGTRSSPIDGVNSSSKFEMTFEPTNSLKLFRQTGLKGAFLKSYQLIYKGQSIIDLRADETTYESYMKGKEKPSLFFLSVNDSFKSNELAYLKTNLALEKNGVEIHEEEILINGLNLVLNAYSYNDTLFVKLKLVNHSLFPVRINPGAMTVKLNSKTLVSIAKHKADEATIPRSQRGYVEERYSIKNSSADDFLINISSVAFMAQKVVPVFHDTTISLKRMKESK